MKKISELIDQAMLEDRPELWDKAINESISYQVIKPDDPEGYFVLGYNYFIKPNRNPEDSARFESEFLICLLKYPNHQLALYYMSVLYFYCNEFSKSLCRLNQTRIDYFYEIAQPWRILKIAELKLACRIQLGDTIQDSEIESFSDLCKTLLHEIILVPCLSEISKSINSSLMKGTADGVLSHNAIKLVAKLIADLGQQRIFNGVAGPFYSLIA